MSTHIFATSIIIYAIRLNMKTDKMKTADRLVQLRGGRSITEEAAFLGLDYQTYYSHQTGKRSIKDSLDVYVNKYEVEPSWLLYGVEKAKPAPERRIVLADSNVARRMVELGDLHAKLLRSDPDTQDDAIEALRGLLDSARE